MSRDASMQQERDTSVVHHIPLHFISHILKRHACQMRREDIEYQLCIPFSDPIAGTECGGFLFRVAVGCISGRRRGVWRAAGNGRLTHGGGWNRKEENPERWYVRWGYGELRRWGDKGP